jgi:hypothetical protein
MANIWWVRLGSSRRLVVRLGAAGSSTPMQSRETTRSLEAECMIEINPVDMIPCWCLLGSAICCSPEGRPLASGPWIPALMEVGPNPAASPLIKEELSHRPGRM